MDRNLLICLDYDFTFSADPELWTEFVLSAQKKGHGVVCVTLRYNNEFEAPDVLNSIGKLCSVIFTNRKAKKRFLEELNVHPDIWIDDEPEHIFRDARR